MFTGNKGVRQDNLKNLSIQEQGKIAEKRPTFENQEKFKQEVNSMKTGLTKTQKTTEIWFNEKEPMIHVRTHNTDLKKRLSSYAEKFPTECKLFDNDYELGCMEFEIKKAGCHSD